MMFSDYILIAEEIICFTREKFPSQFWKSLIIHFSRLIFGHSSPIYIFYKIYKFIF